MHFYKTIHVRTFYIIAKTINLPNIFHAREVHAPHIYTKCLNLRNERASHYRRLLFLETLQAAEKVPSRGIRKHFSALSQCSRLHTLHIHSSAGLFFFFFFFFFIRSRRRRYTYRERISNTSPRERVHCLPALCFVFLYRVSPITSSSTGEYSNSSHR